ncbi:hypothetical protein B0G66_11522 [Bacillus badius]|nr:hypothetical protein B0G66_11522 [Bacillus badius]
MILAYYQFMYLPIKEKIQKGEISLVLKQAAEVGEAVKTLLLEEELTVEQMSMDLNISKQLGSHIKNDRRRMQQDVAKASIQAYDCPAYATDLIHEFSGGYTPPVLRGRAVDWENRLAVEDFAIREVQEVIAILENIRPILNRKPGETTKEERERIAQVTDEIYDAEAALANLKITLAKNYNISLKKRHENRKVVWKAKEWFA